MLKLFESSLITRVITKITQMKLSLQSVLISTKSKNEFQMDGKQYQVLLQLITIFRQEVLVSNLVI